MRIALDARTIFAPQRRGTGRNLVDLYTELASIRPQWRVFAYHRSIKPDANLLPANCEPRRIEVVGDRLDAWQRWRLPLAARRAEADLLHCPANTCPSWLPIDTVVTIHDLIPLDMPEGRSPAQVRRFEQSVRTACRHAAGIVCPSRYTRDRLVRDFGAPAERITVNYWAADRSMARVPQEQWVPVLAKYELNDAVGRYVLHFGAAAPRKNTRRLVEAWARIDPDLRRRRPLLIVGLDRATNEIIRDAATHFAVTDSVHLRGFADEADLPTLLSAAGALAYPSLSEGFGLPLVDAWITRTPVLTSNTTSLPEIAGDAAVQVDPTDPAAIAAGLTRVMTDEALRDELVANGKARAQRFTWRATALRFAAALEQAAGVKAPLRRAA